MHNEFIVLFKYMGHDAHAHITHATDAQDARNAFDVLCVNPLSPTDVTDVSVLTGEEFDSSVLTYIQDGDDDLIPPCYGTFNARTGEYDPGEFPLSVVVVVGRVPFDPSRN